MFAMSEIALLLGEKDLIIFDLNRQIQTLNARIAELEPKQVKDNSSRPTQNIKIVPNQVTGDSNERSELEQPNS